MVVIEAFVYRELKKLETNHEMRMMYYSASGETGKLGTERKSECSYQESNLRPSDYYFGCSTTELQRETRGSQGHKN